MPRVEFEELFRASKGAPVMWNGVEIVMMERVAVPRGVAVRIHRESVRSDGVSRAIAMQCDAAKICVANTKAKSIEMWDETAPPIVTLTLTRPAEVEVYNKWRVEGGAVHCWHAAGAMKVERVDPHMWKFSCNDVDWEGGFQDLRFSLQLVTV